MSKVIPFKDISNPDFEISKDDSLFDELYHIKPGMYDLMDELQDAALEGSSMVYERLKKAARKFPKAPYFKNYLYLYHTERGEFDKAMEINDQIIVEHPEFFTALVNKAMYHFYKEDIEKVPEILGASFDLKVLYPEQSTFYYEDYLKMQSVAVCYFSVIGDLDEAKRRTELMEECEPYDEITGFSKRFFSEARIRADQEKYPKVKTVPESETTKTEWPDFNHDIIRKLYYYAFDLPEDIIDEILALPRHSLIQDLETVIDDSIARYTFFKEIHSLDYDDEGEWIADNNKLDIDIQFVVHAIYFLAEIKAHENLSAVLKTLSQSEEYGYFYFGVNFSINIELPLYVLSQSQPEILMDFMKTPGIYGANKYTVSKVMFQVALLQPKRKKEVLNWYDRVLDFFIESKSSDNVIDNVLLAFFVNELAGFKAVSLFSKIKKLYELGYISDLIGMDIEKVDLMIHHDEAMVLREPLELIPMVEKYQELEMDEIDRMNGDDEDEEDEFDDLFDDDFGELFDNFLNNPEAKRSLDYHQNPSEVLHPVRTEPKIGRNEPCHCGSGKKYKKCCLGKEI